MLSITVNTLVDENNGIGVGGISLRDAIAAAVPGETIDFSVAGTIHLLPANGQLVINKNLTINGPGANALTIDGGHGGDGMPDTADGFRVFTIDDGTATKVNVILRDLIISGGDVGGLSAGRAGGGILSRENVRLERVAVTNNAARTHGGGISHSEGDLQIVNSTVSGNVTSGRGAVYILSGQALVVASTIDGNTGGGLTLMSGTLNVSDSIISGNTAFSGGGIYQYSGFLSVTRSIVRNNTATGLQGHGGGIRTAGLVASISSSTVAGNRTTGNDADGGGIFSSSGHLVLQSSTVDSNSTTGFNAQGGGIFAQGNVTVLYSTVSENFTTGTNSHHGGIGTLGNLTVTQSTISGNRTMGPQSVAGGTGNDGTLTVRYSTIANNFANDAGIGTPGGGGIRKNSGPVIIQHSIVASNGTSSGTSPDIRSGSASLDMDYSLIGNTTGSGISGATGTGNVLNADPVLGVLADNGGQTRTHKLLPGSAAIDAGNPAAISGSNGVPDFDQREFPFIRIFDGDGMGGPRIDIGAYEVQTVANLGLQVDTLVDESDGNYGAGDLSLREAIGLANGSAGANTITFAPALTSGGPATIAQALGEIQIAETLTLTGPGAARLAIDASASDPTPTQDNGDGSRIFVVLSNAVFTVSGLTLTGGDAASDGGAIEVNWSLIISDCTIIGNAADDGGGIFIDLGTMTMTNCEVIGNVAREDGGGIHNDDGTATIRASVIDGNRAEIGGGGIFNPELLEVIGTTISNNTASVGGGIYNRTNLIGTHNTKIVNSTISGNTATSLGGGVFSDSGLTVVQFSTITGNNAPTSKGSGLASHGDPLTRTEVYSSIIASNIGSDVDYVNGGANSFLSMGYNLVGTGNATMSPVNAFNKPGDQIGANPLLGPLSANGGPTMTHALLPGSPAINAGDPASVAGAGNVPQFDQRGAPFTRVLGGRIDIGAVERQPIPPAVFGDYNQNGVVDAADYVVWRKTLGATGGPAYSGADGDGDGVIGQGDYGVWRANFGKTLPAAASAEGGVGSGEGVFEDGKVVAGVFDPGTGTGLAEAGYSEAGSNAAVLIRGDIVRVVRPRQDAAAIWEAGRDDALVAWLASRRTRDVHESSAAVRGRTDVDSNEPFWAAVDAALTGGVASW